MLQTMKRTYIAPSAEALEIAMEAHIMGASQLKINSTTVDGSSALSNKKEWGSASIWDEE